LAAAIETKLGVKATLLRGDGGVFEVRADGTLVFSKKKTGRFPTAAEVVASLGG
jgi:selT/selW/selH-like putative selenoprotein